MTEQRHELFESQPTVASFTVVEALAPTDAIDPTAVTQAVLDAEVERLRAANTRWFGLGEHHGYDHQHTLDAARRADRTSNRVSEMRDAMRETLETRPGFWAKVMGLFR